MLSLALPLIGVGAHGDLFADLFLALAAGAAGAFFSIATGLRNRTVLPDLQSRDNNLDAGLRVVIGTIAGAVFMVLFRTRIVGVSIGTGATGVEGHQVYSWDLVAILGFLAGFLERLVPDLLAQAGQKASLAPAQPSTALAEKAVVRQAAVTAASAAATDKAATRR